MEGKDDSGVVETYRRSSYHKVAFIVSCAMLMVVSIVAAIGLGPVKIGFIESIQTLISHMVGEISDPLNDYFIWEGRLPRALMGVLTGAGLAIGGCVRPTPPSSSTSKYIVPGLCLLTWQIVILSPCPIEICSP
ncbi:MAG: iron chelate uptake ABC transporter family permease subunit [Candidatus Methanomethylophilaceae archaeon]|nr:iron chelate uptake ABC transporter family permease subunit [Candidatus Methanomethylophilaceae archaeon]